MMAGDKTANFLAFDYLISLRHNIKTKLMLENEMSDADPITVQMEYENLPSGQSGKSYFSMSMFNLLSIRLFIPIFFRFFSLKFGISFHPFKTELRTLGDIISISMLCV